MKRERVWLSWKCVHCGRHHKDNIHGIMQCNTKVYDINWKCDKCRKKNLIQFHVEVGYGY